MAVPSNSPKYVCQVCRRKIGVEDSEEILREQLKAFPFSTTENGSETLYDYWLYLTKDEKRIIIEQLVEQITVSEHDIEFGIAPNSPELMAFGQQGSEATTGEETANAASAAPEAGKSVAAEFNEPLLNETEAARFLGISKMTLLRKRNAGKIKFLGLDSVFFTLKKSASFPFLKNARAMPVRSKFPPETLIGLKQITD